MTKKFFGKAFKKQIILKFSVKNFNQKWAARNMLRPLIFGNFFRNIQNIKNGLRPLIFGNFFRNIRNIKNGLRVIFTPLISRLRRQLPPEGKPVSKAISKAIRKHAAPLDLQKFLPKYSENQKWAAPLDLRKFLPKYSEYQKWATQNMLRPSSVGFADSFPPGGSLYHRQFLKF